MEVAAEEEEEMLSLTLETVPRSKVKISTIKNSFILFPDTSVER